MSDELAVMVARIDERQQHTLEAVTLIRLELPALVRRVDALERAGLRAAAWLTGAAATSGAIASLIIKLLS